MEDNTLLWSLDRVESLISSLYEPNSPDIIATDQALLADFQCSSQAWFLAQKLLQRPDEKVRFFGALTIIIKLNRESSSLSEINAKELLDHLIEWYLDSFKTSNGPLVPRKLSSALATYFHHFHQLWPNYVRHLVTCLVSGHSCDPFTLVDSDEISLLFKSAGKNEFKAVLWVITSVMEDVTRLDWNTIDNVGLYDSVVNQASDVAALLCNCLSDRHLSSVGDDAIKCFQTWVVFAQRISARDSHVVSSLRQLLPKAIALLPRGAQFEASAELLIEVLCSYPSLLTSDHFNMLSDIFVSQWSDEQYTRLIRGYGDFDSTQYGQLILAFGEERCQWLMQSDDVRCKIILSRLCGLLTANGFPAVENKIFVPTVEFWSNFTEAMSDLVCSSEISATPWAQHALSLILEAVSSAWHKVIYPSTEELNKWDSSDRTGFADARKDVIDFLQSAYSLCGPQLVATFAELMLKSLDDLTWLHLEAAAFCLAGLADCGGDDIRLDEALHPVFGSSLFSNLNSSNTNIPQRVRQTCLYLIERYTEYFERNVSSLAPALRLLFNLLGDQSLTPTASKSILRLCSSCRHHLHPEIHGFLEEYQSLAALGQLDCISCERVVGAIASVAQAIPNQHHRIQACSRLLQFVHEDASRANELTNGSAADPKLPWFGQPCCDISADEQPGLHVALRALRCLLSVGKGFQSPADLAIDLEAHPFQAHEHDTLLDLLHSQVMAVIVEIEDVFGNHPEVTELICAVLRSGFSESEPGPFVLDTEVVTNYLTSHKGETPRLGLFVTTACSLVSSLHTQGKPDKEKIFTALIHWVVELLQNLPDPEQDPELSQNSIDFACHMLIKSPITLLALQPPKAAEFLFLFSIRVLDGNEPLPKGAAAEFWANFIMMKSDQVQVQQAAKQAMEMLGPLLAQSLARNIGGRASRSELDRLSEPIKKLINRYPMAKMWLQAGLNHTSFPSDKVTSEQKSLFVKKLIR
ncbi:member of the karyopherin-beta [Conoideocrella luteorostrata]|uniref:Member of the karyopherin-beta n=1 Tax=Conoideocrella luteorostrata TaxID=1105319 RepID=A0AAJ0CXW7_9HYPO|nr:member of the karyopherin-beta [Conoideocrella luteorostrata]